MHVNKHVNKVSRPSGNYCIFNINFPPVICRIIIAYTPYTIFRTSDVCQQYKTSVGHVSMITAGMEMHGYLGGWTHK